MPISPEARSALASVVRDAKIRVIGQDLVKNDAEAHLLAAIIKAYAQRNRLSLGRCCALSSRGGFVGH